VASIRSSGGRNHGNACVASTTVSAPAAAAASSTASLSAMRPSADCTALHATTVVLSVTASAKAASGTGRTVTPRDV
jgi:hypothetical protein